MTPAWAPAWPGWTIVPFPALVLAMAVLPMIAPRAWERRSFQLLIVGACALPVLVHLVAAAREPELVEAATSYISFVTTLGALYVTAGGILLFADVEPTPATNLALILLGAALASVIGTTGASMLMIRPLLGINRRRENRAHLVPFFIVAVANAGGLLTPLGDPPLLLGYIGGVPFFWTLRLLPAWLLYVGSAALALYWVDRRAYAREPAPAPATGRESLARGRITLRGWRNVALLLLIVPAAMLPSGVRELTMVAIAVVSFVSTSRALHKDNGFSFGPIIDVAVIFAGLFACIGPMKSALAASAPWFPFRHGWELFWAAGLTSSVLDNAPTYSAFAALARGLSGGPDLVAGISVHKLAAVSIGSVVMGATTYIGNGPNLMVKAIAERERFPTPSFFRYAAFAFALMLPAHIVTSLTLAYLDREADLGPPTGSGRKCGLRVGARKILRASPSPSDSGRRARGAANGPFLATNGGTNWPDEGAMPWKNYSSETFDELLNGDGRPRAAARSVSHFIEALGTEELRGRQQAATAEIRAEGITFVVADEHGNLDREWPFDVIPRVIDGEEWGRIDRGLEQRLAALNCFIGDLYAGQRAVKDGVLPREVLATSRFFLDACVGMKPRYGVWAHICGSDLVRDADGTVYVLEDNLRVPSGVSYMLENRSISKRVFPELFQDQSIKPVDGYTSRLYALLVSLAPEGISQPKVVLLTPGVGNSAYFEHCYLAHQMGIDLVEGSDLVVQDDRVYVRTIGGLEVVDVIYRRIGDAFLDPETFDPASVIGCRGLMRAWRAGNVALANAPGAGVADDKLVYSYVADLIRYYLGEDPILPNVETFRLFDERQRRHVLGDLRNFVVKPANESGGHGVVVGSKASAEELEQVRASIEEDPRNFIAQPIVRLSTAPTLCEAGIEPRHLDLRPFVLSGADSYVTRGGLTRVALRKGSLVVNSSQGGGSKDTFIVERTGGV